MGGRVDEEASTSSLTERNAQASDSDGPHPAPTEAQQRIWKTREFRMQIERVRGDGSAINVTKQENLRENLRDHLQDE